MQMEINVPKPSKKLKVQTPIESPNTCYRHKKNMMRFNMYKERQNSHSASSLGTDNSRNRKNYQSCFEPDHQKLMDLRQDRKNERRVIDSKIQLVEFQDPLT